MSENPVPVSTVTAGNVPREIDFIQRTEGTWRYPALLTAIVFILHTPAFFAKVFDPDEAYIATVADVLSHGGSLYWDAVDRKPPGVFWIYQLLASVTGSTALWIPRMAGVAAHIVTAVLLWKIAQKYMTRRNAVLVGVFFAIATSALPPLDAQSANFEVFMLPAMCAAVLFGLRGNFLRAGIALAVAILMKQTGGITLVPLLVMAARTREPRKVGVLLLGSIAPVALVAWVLGPGRFWFWVFGDANTNYINASGNLRNVLLPAIGVTASVAILNGALVVLAASAARQWRRSIDLWIWFAAGLFGIAAGTRSFGHYYWQILPPLCLLAGFGIEHCSIRRLSICLRSAAAIAIAVAISAFIVPNMQRPMHFEVLGQYVREHTAPEDRIFVWGHVPGIYWESGRLPASRAITTGFLTGHTSARDTSNVGMDSAIPGIWESVMSDFERHPPELIIDTLGARNPSSAEFPIADFPLMYRYLEMGYHQETIVDESVIYRRTHDRPSP